MMLIVYYHTSRSTTNLGLAVFQMWQYLVPAAASGPSPKHMQNTNHYYITMTSLLPFAVLTKATFGIRFV